MGEIDKNICLRIKDLYEGGPWRTHDSFARFLGIKRPQATNILNARRESFSLSELVRYSELFKKPLDFFIPKEKMSSLAGSIEEIDDGSLLLQLTEIEILGAVEGPDSLIAITGRPTMSDTIALPSIILQEEFIEEGIKLQAIRVNQEELHLGNRCTLNRGAVLLFRRITSDWGQENLQAGDFVLLETSKGIFLKRLYFSGEEYILSPPDIHPAKDMIRTAKGSREYRIIGKIVWCGGPLP